MKVAVLYDHSRLREGRAALARLAVALLDHGVHLVRVVPESFDPLGVDPDERTIALIPRLHYPEQVPPWLRGSRDERLTELLERHEPDLVLACGLETWSIAAACAEDMEIPLVLEIDGEEEVDRLSSHRGAKRCAGVILLQPGPEALGARQTASTGRALHVFDDSQREGASGDSPGWRSSPASSPAAGAEGPGGAPRVVLRPGVAPPRGAHRGEHLTRRGDAAPCLALLGGCHRPRLWGQVLDALQGLDQSMPDWHAVVELRGPREHEVWRMLRDRRLLERTATVADSAEVGALIRRCDAIAVVEPLRRNSILLLEAMASEVPIVAAQSDWLPIIDGQTGVVVRGSTAPGADGAHAWRRALERVAGSPVKAAAMGSRAAEFVARWHRTSDQAEAMGDLFVRLVGGPAMPFPRSAGTSLSA